LKKVSKKFEKKFYPKKSSKYVVKTIPNICDINMLKSREYLLKEEAQYG